MDRAGMKRTGTKRTGIKRAGTKQTGTNRMGMNHTGVNRIGRMLKIVGISVALTLAICVVVYDSFYPCVLLPVVLYFVAKRDRKVTENRRRKKLEKDFITAMEMVSSGLLAGLSIENAWFTAMRDFEDMDVANAKSDMLMKMKEISRQLATNQPMEELLLQFGEQTDLDDIRSFAEVFAYAKRSDGDLVKIIERTLIQMRERYEVEQEIQILIASKRLEQRIMNIVPIGLVLFLRVTSPDYLMPMYHNAFGIGIMTGCMAVYIATFWIAARVIQIKV